MTNAHDVCPSQPPPTKTRTHQAEQQKAAEDQSYKTQVAPLNY